jgi:hypothetical protein
MPQMLSHLARPVKRRLQKQLVDTPHQHHVKEIYNHDISPETASRITAKNDGLASGEEALADAGRAA